MVNNTIYYNNFGHWINIFNSKTISHKVNNNNCNFHTIG